MQEMTKGQKYLARAMVPGFVGVAALCWLAWRPCEPVAQAAVAPKAPVVEAPSEPSVLTLAPITIVSRVHQGSPRGVAGVSRKSARVCTDQSPEWHCWSRPLQMGTVDSQVQECDCDPRHGQ